MWGEEFAGEHRLGSEAVGWLIDLDREGFPHREVFFAKVRERFMLSASVEELWARYRQRMPRLVRCRPQVLEGFAGLRAAGWRVAIVTNGMADNQFGKIHQTGLIEAVDAYVLSGPRASVSRTSVCSRLPPVGVAWLWPAEVGWSVIIPSRTSGEGEPLASVRSWSIGGRGRTMSTRRTTWLWTYSRPSRSSRAMRRV